MKLLISLFLFFFAVVIHEFSHGWMAWKLGDPTAKISGRLTLNPLAHIDPIGTIFLPMILIISGSPVLFGWAKPVPVDFYRLHNPKRDMSFVGLAGPAANILFAILLAFLLKIPVLSSSVVIGSMIVINLVLALFNLMPVPPLDGSRILMGLLPDDLAARYAAIEPYGLVIIFGLLYMGIMGKVIWPLVILFAGMLGVRL